MIDTYQMVSTGLYNIAMMMIIDQKSFLYPNTVAKKSYFEVLFWFVTFCD